MSKRVHNNSRKKCPHIPLCFESHRCSMHVFCCTQMCAHTFSNIRFCHLYCEGTVKMVIFYRWVLQQCWLDPGMILMHFFIFVQIMLSWKEWGVLQIWNTSAGRRTSSRAACCLCTVPERPRSSAVLIHSARASLSAVKKHGQVSVFFRLTDRTYIISCCKQLWQTNQVLFFGVKKWHKKRSLLLWF